MNKLTLQLQSCETQKNTKSAASFIIAKHLEKANTMNVSQSQDQKSWMDVLAEMADKPIQEAQPTEEDSAPMSPDPRCNHRSKLVTGLPQQLKDSQTELEKERERLRSNYLHRRAETTLFEQKYG